VRCTLRVIPRVTKADLRREMRARLRTLGESRAEKSRAIVAAIVAHPACARSGVIALFDPLPGEPDVGLLWEKGARDFCYPRVAGDEIEFLRVREPGDLAAAAWHPGIREPRLPEERIVAPAEIQLILVPGLAFTRDGHRLGRGGGFYDRYLAKLPPGTVKIGVCFEMQIVTAIAPESHDVRVDSVITETASA
jgi:5-formyltetrahydrofolate cyclo-ligase